MFSTRRPHVLVCNLYRYIYYLYELIIYWFNNGILILIKLILIVVTVTLVLINIAIYKFMGLYIMGLICIKYSCG